MTLHRLQIDRLCFTARVRESLDSFDVVFGVVPIIPLVTRWETRAHVDEWVCDVIEQVTAEARAAGKYVHVLDPQHIMTT